MVFFDLTVCYFSIEHQCTAYFQENEQYVVCLRAYKRFSTNHLYKLKMFKQSFKSYIRFCSKHFSTTLFYSNLSILKFDNLTNICNLLNLCSNLVLTCYLILFIILPNLIMYTNTVIDKNIATNIINITLVLVILLYYTSLEQLNLNLDFSFC